MIGKVLDFDSFGYYDDFVACMLDAANYGADIVSLSLGVSTTTNPRLNNTLLSVKSLNCTAVIANH